MVHNLSDSPCPTKEADSFACKAESTFRFDRTEDFELDVRNVYSFQMCLRDSLFFMLLVEKFLHFDWLKAVVFLSLIWNTYMWKLQTFAVAESQTFLRAKRPQRRRARRNECFRRLTCRERWENKWWARVQRTQTRSLLGWIFFIETVIGPTLDSLSCQINSRNAP